MSYITWAVSTVLDVTKTWSSSQCFILLKRCMLYISGLQASVMYANFAIDHAFPCCCWIDILHATQTVNCEMYIELCKKAD